MRHAYEKDKTSEAAPFELSRPESVGGPMDPITTEIITSRYGLAMF